MPAKTKCPTQEEMKSHIARFKDLKSTTSQHGANKGIPVEVLEMITAKTTYNIMSPGNLGGQLSPNPPVLGGDAGVFRLVMVDKLIAMGWHFTLDANAPPEVMQP